MRYLLDSEVHTYAFSVAANSIISFIPFIVLLYTLWRAVFHSQIMVQCGGRHGALLSAVEPGLGAARTWLSRGAAGCAVDCRW